MKTTTILLILLLPVLAHSQRRPNYWLKQGVSAATMFTAGWLHGTNEVIKFDYRRFAARRPRADPNWHDIRISYRRKYKNWPSDRRAAYIGSKTWLAWTTDAYHMRATAKNILIAGNIGVSMSLYQKPDWKQIVIQAVASWAAFAVGSGAAHAYYKPID